MTFRTMYTERVRKTSDPGSRFANDYEVQINNKGHKSLLFTGTHDIYEEIQSYAEECKIENILARAAAGDVNALNQRQGAYMDISDCPKDLAEAQRSILKLTHAFESLPANIRNKFDNSKEKFVQMYGTEEWLDFMGFKTQETEKAEEAPKNFSDPAVEKAAEVLTPEA